MRSRRPELRRKPPWLRVRFPILIIASTTVIAFMFFGRVLQACGGADFFTDLSSALFGRFRGGILHWADTVGGDAILKKLEKYAALGKRFEPTPLLKQAASGKGFFG